MKLKQRISIALLVTGIILIMFICSVVMWRKHAMVVTPKANCEYEVLVNKPVDAEIICNTRIISPESKLVMGLARFPEYGAYLHIEYDKGAIKIKIDKKQTPDSQVKYTSADPKMMD